MVIRYDNPVLSQDELRILISSAGLAPSMHNTQPWRFEVTGRVVDVLLDEDRTLPAEDRSGRMTRIGLGAAAFNLRVTAAMLGFETTLAVDPDPDRPDVAVRIFLGSRRPTATSPIGSLYGELRRRHTYRGPLMAAVVSPLVLEQLNAAARAEGAELRWLDQYAETQLKRILHAADYLDLHDEDRLTERGRWIGGDRTRDGVPQAALGPLPARSAIVRDLAAGFDHHARSSAVFETNPRIAVLTTAADDPVAWTRAGMALQHLLLIATSYDLTVSFLNQAVEYAQLRSHVQELVGRSPRPQLILRAGYPAQTAAETPRLPWQQTLDSLVDDWHPGIVQACSDA
ncbi:Acg family FMN-binding oxidoreductase [Kribbella sp. NPDC051620]|uniref:Acg family FMN-binding oxidoreductase n=1 Tax=Kribbella sp. NPDC051620 TaxID=3364120 RepID=UPI0037A7DF21